MSESKLKQVCEHTAVALDATVNAMEGTNVLIVAVGAMCKTCRRRFAFIGDFDETPTIERPSISTDRRMVLLPMVPEKAAPLIMPERVN